MKLRQTWDVRLAAEGRQRLNLFDPDFFTDEEQIEMFGTTKRGKGKEGSLSTSSSRTAKDKKEKDKKKKLIKDFSSLSLNEQKELLKILS